VLLYVHVCVHVCVLCVLCDWWGLWLDAIASQRLGKQQRKFGNVTEEGTKWHHGGISIDARNESSCQSITS